MNQPTLFRRLLPHLLALLALLLLAFAYFSPAMSGKTLNMADIQQSVASAREVREIGQQTGVKPLWTDAVFSGMPAYMIDFDYPHIYVYKAVMGVLSILPATVMVVFVLMLGAYILLVVLGCNVWLAALGAVGFGFGTFSIVSLEAGHISKILALGFGAGLLAGVVLALRGRYWAGAALAGLFGCMELGANHIQITYYLFMTIGLYVLVAGITLVREGRGRQLALGLAALAVAGVLAGSSFGKRLLVLNEYTKETIRGRSELTAKTTNPDGNATGNETKSGLDKDYAFSYSYGVGETLTLLIPNAFGGASGGGLGTGSEFYKLVVGIGLDPEQAQQLVERSIPVYWGDQPMVGGPAYAGAALLFLFVLGMFVIRTPVRWWLLSATILLIMLAWGKNFAGFNYLLFDYLPYLNKFRAMTMTLTLAQLFIGAGAALAVQTIVSQKLTFAQLKQPILISFALTGGLALVLALLGGTLLSFRSANDADIMEQLGNYLKRPGNEFLTALVQDRQGLLRADAFRSFVLIALTAGAIWVYVGQKLHPGFFYPTLLLIVVFDLFGVDKRYLNSDDFVPKTQLSQVFEPTAADQQILQDTSPQYRVFDQTDNFMNSNRASYFHRSIGGYHAAKLRRYQELITYAFPVNTLHVLNMLNVKYVIQPGQPDPANPQQPAGPVAIPNPEALGSAWFVQTVQTVPDADAEIAAMKTLNPADTAVVDQQFAAQLAGLPAVMNTTGSRVRLTNYRPDNMVYEVNAAQEGVAVFSEIYYRGQQDWMVTIDGKPAPSFRADYVLRAMRVPAGKHTVAFKFDPPAANTGNTLDLIGNVLLIGLLGFVAFREVRGEQNSPMPESNLPGSPTPVAPMAVNNPAVPAPTTPTGGSKSRKPKSR